MSSTSGRVLSRFLRRMLLPNRAEFEILRSDIAILRDHVEQIDRCLTCGRPGSVMSDEELRVRRERHHTEMAQIRAAQHRVSRETCFPFSVAAMIGAALVVPWLLSQLW